MRPIKFRQPRIAQGKFHHWHYWGYVDGKEGHFVAPLPPNTGGDSYQFTGLKDKNGKDIYEGDIIIVPTHYVGDYWQKEKRDIVEWDNSDCPEGPGFWLAPSGVNWRDCEVIGNIHENSELQSNVRQDL